MFGVVWHNEISQLFSILGMSNSNLHFFPGHLTKIMFLFMHIFSTLKYIFTFISEWRASKACSLKYPNPEFICHNIYLNKSLFYQKGGPHDPCSWCLRTRIYAQMSYVPYNLSNHLKTQGKNMIYLRSHSDT